MRGSRQLLTIEEAASYLNVSKTSLRRWTNSGRLRCRRVGVRGERRFALADLEGFLYVMRENAAAGEAADLARRPMDLLDEAAAGGAVRHVCSHFHEPEESWRLFLPYFRDHAASGAPVIYIHDSTSRERFRADVAAAGWDPAELEARGLLRLIHSSQAYLRTGTFTADGMLAFVAGAIDDARSRGHRKILVSGEMTWSLTGAPGCGEMIAYEERLNDLLLAYPEVTIVCHYSTERFGARLTLDALRAHPFVQLPERLFPGFYSRNAATPR